MLNKVQASPAAPPTVGEYLTPRAAAALLAVSVASLARWRMRGTGPAYCLVSRRAIRYQRAAISAWLSERERNSTATA